MNNSKVDLLLFKGNLTNNLKRLVMASILQPEKMGQIVQKEKEKSNLDHPKSKAASPAPTFL
jgi:hypothetical protein